MNDILKPPIKWIGGKTQILHHIHKRLLGGNYDTYYEPFVGGGSVLLMVLSMIEEKQIHIKKLEISDINWQLIGLYNTIKKYPLELIECIDRLYKHYTDAENILYKPRHKVVITTLENSISMGKSYVYYYLRKIYNEIEIPCIELSALFIIINKLCFRGLYREGKNGFNTAYGNYLNPTIYDKDNIINMSIVFNKHNVVFKHQSYDIIKTTDKDLVYLDPPYYPIKKTAFVKYTKHCFDHIKFVEFTKRYSNFIMNNSYCEFVLDNYKNYNTEKILCKRRINVKDPADTDYELIISSKSICRFDPVQNIA